MMLVMYTGAVAIEGELLFCKLGCIAQVISRSFTTEVIRKDLTFPGMISQVLLSFYIHASQVYAVGLDKMLVISLFGPRHGHLVQAKLDKSSI